MNMRNRANKTLGELSLGSAKKSPRENLTSGFTARLFQRSSVILVFLIVIICVSGFLLYFKNHTWGAWGDDSAGYIYLAGRMFQDKPLVYQDALARKAYDFFQSPRKVQFVLPTHYKLISPDGYIASKYPLGLSILMNIFSKIRGADIGFYAVNPFFAIANLVLTFSLFILLFQRKLWAFAAALALGFSKLYYEQAVSQPMREMTSITFFLLTVIFLILAFRKERWWLFALAGLSFGFAADIRETTISLVPAVAALFLFQKKWLKRMILFSCFVLIGLLPTFWNSYTISKYNQPLRTKDTNVVLTSNIDHLRSFSFQNVFYNQGRFAAGEGSLPHFWEVMHNVSPWVPFLLCAGLGLVFLYKKDKRLFFFFSFWIIGVLGFFSFWINPYARYILPMYPALVMAGTLGIIFFIRDIVPQIFSHRKLLILLFFLGLFLSYRDAFQNILETQKSEKPLDRGISFNDLQILKNIQDEVVGESILVMVGRYQYGISETYMAHTAGRVIKLPDDERLSGEDEKNIAAFFKKLEAEGETFFLWQDPSATLEENNFIAKYFSLSKVQSYAFSFTPEVVLSKVSVQ